MLLLHLQTTLCALLSLTSAAVLVNPHRNANGLDAAAFDVNKRQQHRYRTSTTTTTRTTTSSMTTRSTTLVTSTTTIPTTTTSVKPSTSITSTTTTSSTKPSTTTTNTSTTSTTSTTRSSTTSTTSTSTTTSTTTTSAGFPTDAAYIDTVIRHHNVHRSNHSASAVSWSSSLADTARQIAQSCSYGHNTTVNGGGYGQNIAAGYSGYSIGQPITLGFYNNEINSYTYYGSEPDLNTLGSWGHMTQIVWKGTSSVGCFTADCTAQGLKNVGSNVPPWFTVCNYGPPGNVVGAFAQNVGKPSGAATVDASYGCGSVTNCA